MFRQYIRHRQCDDYESFTADKTCLLQRTVCVTLCWKTVRFINLKLRKLINARARIYRESVREEIDLLGQLFPLNVHRLLKLNLKF